MSVACRLLEVLPDETLSQWRYVQMACRFLVVLLRRDTPVSADVARFFYKYSTSPQPTIRVEAQRCVICLYFCSPSLRPSIE